MRARPVNPVFARELRQRMRSRWTPFVLTAYLLLLVGLLQLVFTAVDHEARRPFGPGVLAASAQGRVIFQSLLFFMLLLVLFVVPGLTAGAIAGERERQTLVPLQVTALGPASIVVGKLLASLAFVLLLLVAALPLVGASFVAGGITFAEALRGMAMTAAAAVTLACLCLAASSVLRRVQTATIVAYGLSGFLVVGTFVVFGAQAVISGDGSRTSTAVLAANPLVATADVLSGTGGGIEAVPSPFAPFQRLLDEREERRFPGGGADGVEPGVMVEIEPGRPAPFFGDAPVDLPLRGPDGRPRRSGAPFWLGSLGVWAALCAASLALATLRVRVPVKGER